MNPSLSRIEGKTIVDSTGRKIILHEPDLLEIFDLTDAMPKDSQALEMAMNTLYIAKIDDQIIIPAKSHAQIRANLKIICISGMSAVMDFLNKESIKTEQEAVEKIKK